jgi:hypothetical protein
MRSNPLNISFGRVLAGDKLDEWHKLVAKINHINLIVEREKFVWSLQKNGQFTVLSIYLHIIDQNTPFSYKLIWKIKIPLKMKIFFCLQRGVILTKDNLI